MDDLRDQPRAGFVSARDRLNAAGAEIVHFDAPRLARAFELAGMLYTADAYAWWRDRIEAAPEKMFNKILDRIRPGGAFSAADYIAGWAELHEIRADFHAAMARFDAVVMPTAPNLPPKLERLKTDGDYYVTENLLALRNTRIGNLMGLCSLTLPTGLPSTGIMLNALPGREEALLRLGLAAEKALG